jgi:hypothetical protein
MVNAAALSCFLIAWTAADGAGVDGFADGGLGAGESAEIGFELQNSGGEVSVRTNSAAVTSSTGSKRLSPRKGDSVAMVFEFLSLGTMRSGVRERGEVGTAAGLSGSKSGKTKICFSWLKGSRGPCNLKLRMPVSC